MNDKQISNIDLMDFEELIETWFLLILSGKTSSIKEIIDKEIEKKSFYLLKGKYLLGCYAESVLTNRNYIQLELKIHQWQNMYGFYPSDKQFYYLIRGISCFNQGKFHDSLVYMKKAESFEVYDYYDYIGFFSAKIYLMVHEYIDAYSYALKAKKLFIKRNNMKKVSELEQLIHILYERTNIIDAVNVDLKMLV